MKTFEQPRKLFSSDNFQQDRETWIASLDPESIDAPIVDIISTLNKLPFCFTLQSCYGHFLYDGHDDQYNTAPLPESPVDSEIQYRIAYLALCIANNPQGKKLIEILAHVPNPHLDTIQFGSAAFFWDKQPNTYVLQISPSNYQDRDIMTLSYQESLSVQIARNYFFDTLRQILTMVT